MSMRRSLTSAYGTSPTSLIPVSESQFSMGAGERKEGAGLTVYVSAEYAVCDSEQSPHAWHSLVLSLSRTGPLAT